VLGGALLRPSHISDGLLGVCYAGWQPPLYNLAMASQHVRAGRWQLDQAVGWRSWVAEAGSVRLRRLGNLTAAVDAVVFDRMRDRASAEAVIGQLLPTLSSCDTLNFDTEEQTLAYAIWHLADRYGRVLQAFDGLFAAGHLPIRKTRMSVLDVGAGPAPAVYAAVDYYSDLEKWCSATRQPLQPHLPSYLDTLDRGPAWRHFLHMLSEAILSRDPSQRPVPFGVTYSDLRGFSVQSEHRNGIRRAVARLRAEYDFYDEYLSDRDARGIALQERAYPPGAYDVIVMCNFLTTEEITANFSVEIGDLARNLTPGGVLVVLGSSAKRYDAIYAQLDTIIAEAARLRRVAVFDGPVKAHPDSRVQRIVSEQLIGGLDRARRLAPEAFATIRQQLKPDVRGLDAAAVQFPRFNVLAFKNEGRRPRGRWGRSRRHGDAS
jgi:hypothetical protein